MNAATESDRRTTLEAGAGRPFRFTLVLEEGRGSLQSWLGGKWALVVGGVGVLVAGGAGGLAALFTSTREEVRPTGAFALAGAGVGALVVAWHLRPRRVQFLRRDGGWWWRGRGVNSLRWRELTEESPLRLEREILSSVEGFTLWAGSVRLLSYLGNPSIGRRVGLAFEGAGVPLRTVVKRPDAGPAS